MRLRLVRVLLALAVALACGLAATRGARADGDPASDVLYSASLFVPFQRPPSAAVETELKTTIAEANRSGYRIRVALIASQYDLGTAAALWGKPRQYAQFLWRELSYLYRGRLLVVMPGGFGLYAKGGANGRDRRVVAGLPPAGKDVDGLGRSATAAVRKLAAAAGHPLPASHKGASSIRDRILVVLGVLLLGAVLAWRRPRGLRSAIRSARSRE